MGFAVRRRNAGWEVKTMGTLRRRSVSVVTLLLLMPSSTFAEEWSRRRTLDGAGRVAGVLIGGAARRGGTRERLAGMVLSEVEILIRDRERRPPDPPPEWPDERRRPPAPRRGEREAPLVMPVVGVTRHDLRDSFGDARSGGRRHRGIDIFAPRWTEVVAVTEGTLTAIAEGGLAGRSLWLVGDDGRSYFYGHLQGWARGIEDGTPVRAGNVVGYVGNSGNAAGLPTHLHFEVHDDGGAVNPYPVLARAEPIGPSRRVASGGASGRSGR
jgi:murein DD-endopeptidase MepM/ murein hydrolase activator NlpD